MVFESENMKVAAVIPCFKVTEFVKDLIDGIGPEVDQIYAVDDACPDGSGKFIQENVNDKRVTVLFLKENQGVGGAVLTGLNAAYEAGMDIGVKLDGDGQMDPALIKRFIRPIREGRADYTKGNRFYNPEDLREMPKGRLIGNAVLSFVSKFSTGYWNSFDPTNGYIALNLHVLPYLNTAKIAKRYFFETDLLFRAGLVKAKVLDIPMFALYADEVSNLHFHKEAWPFMKGNTKNFFKRIIYNYFLRDFSVATLELLVGSVAMIFGIVYGLVKIGGPVAASAGTVMMAALPILSGITLLVGFLNYDIQQTPKDALGSRLLDKE